jgi:simple sugar transport system permease protein
VEGQLLVGAMLAAVTALRFPGPAGVALGVLAGMLGGALWALPAGWIKAFRNGHEVITTIMLNNVAALITTALVAGPLKDPHNQAPTTTSLGPGTHLPDLYNHPPVTISSGMLLGILVAIGLAFYLKRTVSGYELESVGANPTAAKLAGVDPKRVIMRSMLASGALAGLAGSVQVLAYEGRFYSGFSPGYGFDALGVALLAGGNALAVLPSSLLFGILAKGGVSLQIDGVPKGITTVILGFLIIVAAAVRFRRLRAVDE